MGHPMHLLSNTFKAGNSNKNITNKSDHTKTTPNLKVKPKVIKPIQESEQTGLAVLVPQCHVTCKPLAESSLSFYQCLIL